MVSDFPSLFCAVGKGIHRNKRSRAPEEACPRRFCRGLRKGRGVMFSCGGYGKRRRNVGRKHGCCRHARGGNYEERDNIGETLREHAELSEAFSYAARYCEAVGERLEIRVRPAEKTPPRGHCPSGGVFGCFGPQTYVGERSLSGFLRGFPFLSEAGRAEASGRYFRG